MDNQALGQSEERRQFQQYFDRLLGEVEASEKHRDPRPIKGKIEQTLGRDEGDCQGVGN
jgi:hypothetical protein